MTTNELRARAGAAALMITVSMAAAQSGRFFTVDGVGGDDYNGSIAYGVSGDGNVVVGSMGVGYGSDALHWTYPDGISTANAYDSVAYAADYDGDRVAVTQYSGQPAVWDGTNELVWLPLTEFGNSARAVAVSSSGLVLVGSGSVGLLGTDQEMLRWEDAGYPAFDLFRQFDATGENAITPYISFGQGVSRDGAVMVGQSFDESGRIRAAVKSGGIWSYLPELAVVGGFESIAYAADDDGSVVVGWAYDAALRQRPVRWSSSGVQVLTADFEGEAFVVSADGEIVVGRYRPQQGGESAFVWINGQGFFDMQEYLTTVGGFSFCDWSLAEARGISDDGLVVAGRAYDEDSNQSTAFVVDLRGGGRCAGDVDQDGDSDLDDFFTFLGAFDAGTCQGDLPPLDGDSDLDDFFTFLGAFDAGC